MNSLKDLQVAKLDFILVGIDRDKFCKLMIENDTYYTDLKGVVSLCNNNRIGILLADSTSNCNMYTDNLKSLGLKSYIVPISFCGNKFKWLEQN